MEKNTKLTMAGRDPHKYHGSVNPPVYHASTLAFSSYEKFKACEGRYTYALHGTPTMTALEEAVTALETLPHAKRGKAEMADVTGAGCRLLPSGMAAINLVMFSFAKAGGHILYPDNAYDPTRLLSNNLLKRLGLDCQSYKPTVTAAELDALIKDNTCLIFFESPGSLSFEIQDIPALVQVAKARGIPTAIDNSWAGGLYYQPLLDGVDVSLQAGTKYLCGSADLLLGTVVANGKHLPHIHKTWRQMGSAPGPDDMHRAMIGLRSMEVRLARHFESAVEIAKRLEAHQAVKTVVCPALESHPQHHIWQRDFQGAAGLFAFQLKGDISDGRLSAMLDDMKHYIMGFSWGGFESLLIPFWLENLRDYPILDGDGQWFRIHIGLEDVEDLWRDLDAALARWQGFKG